MSHGMEAGDLMFSVREPVWHLNQNRDKVTMLGDTPDRETGMRLSGQAFRIVERPVLLAPEGLAWDSEGILRDSNGAVLRVVGDPVPGWKALARDDTGAVLHIAKNSYTVVQPEVLWDLQEALQDADGELVQYITAGTLKGGAIMWVLSRLDRPHQVTGTSTLVYPYLLTSTTHDGSGALRADVTEVTVVCWNTFSLATGARSDRSYRFRHTRNVSDRIEDAKGALFGALRSHDAFVELAEELAELRVSPAGVGMFLKSFIPDPPAYLVSDRVLANVEEARQKVRSVLNGGVTVPEYHANTAYGLFSAGTEYLDHLRPARNADTMFGRSLLRQERAKDKLVPLVRRIARDYALT